MYHTEPSFYTDDHRRLLDRVCEQAAAVIHNSIVFEQTQEDSLTDPLTGLPNTRFMFMHLSRELARAERLKAEVSLLVMDLDDFKEINDSHGHHVGDRALREVASVLRAAIRPYDICVRYAGDEFIVVLSGCGARRPRRKRVELQQAVDDARCSRRRPGRGSRWRSASAPRSSRTTATPTRRCWRRPTAGCTATRARARRRARGLVRTMPQPTAPRPVARALAPSNPRPPGKLAHSGAPHCSLKDVRAASARLRLLTIDVARSRSHTSPARRARRPPRGIRPSSVFDRLFA